MTHDPMTDADGAQRTLGRLLGELPDRHAPASLEARVFGELQRRAAGRWWERGFRHWPIAARGAFVALCAALSGLTVLESTWATALCSRVLSAVGSRSMSWAQPAVSATAWDFDIAAELAHSVTPLWLYGAIALGSLLYAALLGLGAAAYHLLYRVPPMVGGRAPIGRPR